MRFEPAVPTIDRSYTTQPHGPAIVHVLHIKYIFPEILYSFVVISVLNEVC